MRRVGCVYGARTPRRSGSLAPSWANSILRTPSRCERRGRTPRRTRRAMRTTPTPGALFLAPLHSGRRRVRAFRTGRTRTSNARGGLLCHVAAVARQHGHGDDSIPLTRDGARTGSGVSASMAASPGTTTRTPGIFGRSARPGNSQSSPRTGSIVRGDGQRCRLSAETEDLAQASRDSQDRRSPGGPRRNNAQSLERSTLTTYVRQRPGTPGLSCWSHLRESNP